MFFEGYQCSWHIQVVCVSSTLLLLHEKIHVSQAVWKDHYIFFLHPDSMCWRLPHFLTISLPVSGSELQDFVTAGSIKPIKFDAVQKTETLKSAVKKQNKILIHFTWFSCIFHQSHHHGCRQLRDLQSGEKAVE